MKNRYIYSIVAIIISLLLIIVGINRKEFQSYFNKATQVCTQCIGIG